MVVAQLIWMEVWLRDLSRFTGLGAKIRVGTNQVGRTRIKTLGSEVHYWGVRDGAKLDQPSWRLESWFESFHCTLKEEIGGWLAPLTCLPASSRNKSSLEAGIFIQSLKFLSSFSRIISAVNKKITDVQENQVFIWVVLCVELYPLKDVLMS